MADSCIDYNHFTRWILQFDQAAALDENKDKPLRFDVWQTTAAQIAEATKNFSSSNVPKLNNSPRVITKIENALKRAQQSAESFAGRNYGYTDQKDIFNDEFSKEMSIALHEMFESVKGEADKARNLGLDVVDVSNTGVLPALPLSRVAASIGRKIAFQKGYRFKRALDYGSAAEIEAMYYDLGNAALQLLEKRGYVKREEGVPTIMDYLEKKDLKTDFPKNEATRSDVRSVSLNEKKLGINANSDEQAYFNDRTEADLTNTPLGVLSEKLRAANLMLQPATVVLPDTEATKSDEELEIWDDGVNELDPITSEARKKLYENPLTVNRALSSFLDLMSADQKRTGTTASKQISEVFGRKKRMVAELFGIKRSDDYSIDKKESVSGQNLSKTTPLDDLVEYWDMMSGDLHMPMKVGRNARLYYLNSVLNAHGSKQMRALLTPGEQTIDVKSDDFDYLVYQVNEALGGKFTYEDIVSGDALNGPLETLQAFQNATSLNKKANALGKLISDFRGTDFITLVTSLQAVSDIRNAKDGKVVTEFTVHADATASGGTLTLLQALGSSPRVKDLLQRIGLLKAEDNLEAPLDDLYGLMSEMVEEYLEGETGAGFGPDLDETDNVELLRETIRYLFLDQGKDLREFSKDPTMTFVYGQGRTGAIQSLATSLADRVMDNLDHKSTDAFLKKLFSEEEIAEMSKADIRRQKKIRGTGVTKVNLKKWQEKGLYKAIVNKLTESGMPGTIYDLMDSGLKKEYLQNYNKRSAEVYKLMKMLPTNLNMKVLPAGAVLAGKEPTKDNLVKYGMPVTKAVWVLNSFKGSNDTVLTRREKLTKTVSDVSTVHGSDAALLYHSLMDVDPDTGVVVIHDDVRGTVKTVRAMEKAYREKAIELASQYDIHQQLVKAVAAYNPELAKTEQFKALEAQIDEDMTNKQLDIKNLFNHETTALIGDGDKYKAYAKGGKADKADKADKTETKTSSKKKDTVQSTIPNGTVIDKQSFGEQQVTLDMGDETTEIYAQEAWDDLITRKDKIQKFKKKVEKCLQS